MGIYVGNAKSNATEFLGLLYGMRTAIHCGITKMSVFGDSDVLFKYNFS